MTQEDLIARLHRLEAAQYATSVVLAQVAAFLPAPHFLLAHLAEDSEVSLLYKTVPEEFREESGRKIQQIYAMLLGMRRGIAEADLNKIPQ